MSNKNLTIGLVIAMVIAIAGLFYPTMKTAVLSFGSTDCTQTTCLAGGLAITTGNLSVDSGNVTASSTIMTAAVGCFQLYATSTATVIHEIFVTTGATSTFNGTVYWKYGSCS